MIRDKMSIKESDHNTINYFTGDTLSFHFLKDSKLTLLHLTLPELSLTDHLDSTTPLKMASIYKKAKKNNLSYW